jgi:transcriptional regulator with AAA-type ATPase domain
MSLPDLTSKPPHRVVDEVLDSIVRIPKELSESISSALDKGPLGPTGPHRIVDNIVKGVGTAIEDLGEGIAKGLDVPTKIVRR